MRSAARRAASRSPSLLVSACSAWILRSFDQSLAEGLPSLKRQVWTSSPAVEDQQVDLHEYVGHFGAVAGFDGYLPGRTLSIEDPAPITADQCDPTPAVFFEGGGLEASLSI